MIESIETIHVGDVVRLPAVFKNTEGDEIDPTAVKVKIKTPGNGTTTEYVYGMHVQLVKGSVGNYYIDIDVDESGPWRWRWYSTGSGKAAKEGFFNVEETNF